MSLTYKSYNPDVLNCLANLSSDEVFTPPRVANDMLDMLPADFWTNPNATFLDPVSKSGIFLREITKRLLKGLESQIPDLQERLNHILSKQVFGIAITELTSLMSRRSVYCSKHANGEYSICTALNDKEGNIKYQNIEHTWDNKGKCVFCGASAKLYERGDDLEYHAYQFIHTEHPEEIFNNMKFDVIIGNPPYQMDDGGHGASASPIYDKFVEQAIKMSPRYISMIIPSRWFAGGKGLENFRKSMQNDRRIVKIVDYFNAKECFPNISLGGGVNFFLWDKDYNGSCCFHNILNGKESIRHRYLDEYDIIIRNNNAIDIVHKVIEENFSSLSEIVSTRNPFGLVSSIRGVANEFEKCKTLYSSAGKGYIPIDEISDNFGFLDKYKIMISKVTSEHAGEPDKAGMYKVLSKTKLLCPGEVCTDSYLVIGGYNTKQEALNLQKFIHTKFCRFLLLQAVTSINLSKSKFEFVPLLNFNESLNDRDLFNMYNLNEEEISLINNLIKEME